MTYATRRMNLEDILLTKISQSPKYKHYMIPIKYEVPRIVNFIETESRMMISNG